MSKYRSMKGYDALDDIDRRLSAIEHRLLTEQIPEEGQRMNGKFPNQDECRVYFSGFGREDCWEGFYFHYESLGWRSGANVPISNWRAKATEWMRQNALPEPVLEPKQETASKTPRVITIDDLRAAQEQGAVPMPSDIRDKLKRLGMQNI